MFAINDTIMVVDQSNFTLGAKVIVTKEGKILVHTTIEDMSDLEQSVINLADKMDISNIFIKTVALENQEKALSKYKNILNSNFSKKVDKIHFHMI